jgi:DNA end-binding protein Ku
MPRSIWKGAISFGLVHIPVELHTAVSDKGLDLTMLDKRDFSPIGFKRYNKHTGKEVVWDDIIKGYEYADDEYVVLSDEDLKRANVKATQTIDIVTFVDAALVPLTYYETPYYLAPSKGGDKVYALLRETLRKAGKIGIATVVIRTKQHLCALVCIDDAIVLNTLRYADEIRAPDDLELPAQGLKAAGISDKELAMAMSLVDGMSEAWKPEQYHDSYREDVLALVDRKIKAKETKTITQPDKEDAAPARSDNVIDLVALLQQSLGRKGKAGTTAKEDEDGQEKAPAAAPAKRTRAAAKPALKAVPKAQAKPVKKPLTKSVTKPAAKTARAPAKPTKAAAPAKTASRPAPRRKAA